MKKLSKLGQIDSGATVCLTNEQTGSEERHTVHSVRNKGDIAEAVRISDGHIHFLTQHVIAGKSWAKKVSFENAHEKSKC